MMGNAKCPALGRTLKDNTLDVVAKNVTIVAKDLTGKDGGDWRASYGCVFAQCGVFLRTRLLHPKESAQLTRIGRSHLRVAAKMLNYRCYYRVYRSAIDWLFSTLTGSPH